MPDFLVNLFKRLPRPSLTNILLGVLILLQVPLWFGQGSWLRVWHLERQLQARLTENDARRLRIAELEGEARDLRRSPRAAEERARYELGMIMPGERFVQWGTPAAAPSPGSDISAGPSGGAPANAGSQAPQKRVSPPR
jgi:cell division protein FtsB